MSTEMDDRDTREGTVDTGATGLEKSSKKRVPASSTAAAAAANAVRCIAYQNGNVHGGCELLVPKTITELLRLAETELELPEPPRRIYFDGGRELTGENVPGSSSPTALGVREGTFLWFSAGADYIDPRKDFFDPEMGAMITSELASSNTLPPALQAHLNTQLGDDTVIWLARPAEWRAVARMAVISALVMGALCALGAVFKTRGMWGFLIMLAIAIIAAIWRLGVSIFREYYAVTNKHVMVLNAGLLPVSDGPLRKVLEVLVPGLLPDAKVWKYADLRREDVAVYRALGRHTLSFAPPYEAFQYISQDHAEMLKDLLMEYIPLTTSNMNL